MNLLKECGQNWKMAKIYKFQVIDRCLYLKEKKLLIIGDLHLGYENTMIEKGIAIPLTQKRESITVFNRIIKECNKKIEKIIFLGDIKHHFGKVLVQEKNDFEEILEYFKESLKELKEVIIIKGNHDTNLMYLIKEYPFVSLKDFLFIDKMLFIHGDKWSIERVHKHIPFSDLVITGHYHPAFVLKEPRGIKEEKYKCFLYGNYSGFNKKTIFVPSFFPLIEGSDIIKDLDIYRKGMKIIAVTNEGKLYKFRKV